MKQSKQISPIDSLKSAFVALEIGKYVLTMFRESLTNKELKDFEKGLTEEQITSFAKYGNNKGDEQENEEI